MLRKFLTATVALTLAATTPVFAQTSNPTCTTTKAINAQSGNTPSSKTTMADTSSDSGNTGAGASSASIGTGPVDKTGVNSPCPQ